MSNKPTDKELEVICNIVVAYISNHNAEYNTPLDNDKLTKLIISTREGVVYNPKPQPQPRLFHLTPAVQIEKSVTPNHIICLECGEKFKSIKRHLRVYYGLSPEEYRKKWGLENDYPIAAPNYSAERAKIAKKMGLGKRK